MDTSLLRQFLHNHPIFGGLNLDDIEYLLTTAQVLSLQPGEVLLHQDDLGTDVYLVIEGRLQASIHSSSGFEVPIRDLISGDVVGEISMLAGQHRTATITAWAASSLLRLSRDEISHLSEHTPGLIEAMGLEALPRVRFSQLVSVLTGLFGEIDHLTFQEIEDRIVWRRLKAGEILFRQGDPADSLYIVITGRLRIEMQSGDQQPKVIGEVSRGEFTGEFGLITNEPRSATVYAVRDTQVIQLTQPLFEHLWVKQAATMLHFTRLIIQRELRLNRAKTTQHKDFSAIAILPVHPSVEIETFVIQLSEALSRKASTLHLSSRRFDERFGQSGAAQTEPDHPAGLLIQGWLDEKENEHRYILYQTDQQLSTWTQLCLNRADRILLVGRPEEDPTPGEIENALATLGLKTRQELALIQPDALSRPIGTNAWLNQRQIQAHHHIRMGSLADFDRLARRLTGSATGLVLSGGGARGWSHLGAIQGLEEAGIGFDMVGGSSMGALISAGYANGFSVQDMHELAKTFSAPEKLLDYTLPFVSLTTSRKLTDLMHHLFGTVEIEDLWLPFFCVSTNVTRAEPMVHQSGPLWESVRASIAIPGIFSPMLFGKDILVDGGVINNFPVDVMRELCEGGTVIGANATAQPERFHDYSFGPSISGWQILREKLLPIGKRQRAPSILSNLIRSTEVNSLYQMRFVKAAADLVIEPAVGQYGTLDFDRYEEIIAAGYAATKNIELEKVQASVLAI